MDFGITSTMERKWVRRATKLPIRGVQARMIRVYSDAWWRGRHWIHWMGNDYKRTINNQGTKMLKTKGWRIESAWFLQLPEEERAKVDFWMMTEKVDRRNIYAEGKSLKLIRVHRLGPDFERWLQFVRYHMQSGRLKLTKAKRAVLKRIGIERVVI